MGNSMMGLREESRMYDPEKRAGFASQEGLSKSQSKLWEAISTKFKNVE